MKFDFNFKNFNPRNLLPDLEEYDSFKDFLSEKSPVLWEGFFVLIFIFFLSYHFLITPPKNFPLSTVVHIEEGQNLDQIAEKLKQKKIIRSKTFFKIGVKIFGDDTTVMHGDYFFEKKKDSLRVARRMVKGLFGLTPVKITLYEGLTAQEMAEIIAKKFNQFDPVEFNSIVQKENLEGYLFPDTYLFLPNVKAKDVIREMQINFRSKITKLQEDIVASGRSLHEIIVMASLLEEEARTLKTKKIISGILWNRFNIEMPLQVDAVFPYIIGKNTYEVTLDDLKIDSPYNTYQYKGLPPGAISNPGLDSIIAAVNPEKTDYLYYLSDKSGNMYYSIDYEGHLYNKALYMN